eukprot:scaffold30643_cov35-Tisochrysis_lutea.AAC.3
MAAPRGPSCPPMDRRAFAGITSSCKASNFSSGTARGDGTMLYLTGHKQFALHREAAIPFAG